MRFAPGGGFAYRPNEILVRDAVADEAQEVLRERFPEVEIQPSDPQGGWVRLSGLPQALEALDALHQWGVPAQVNHVLFSTVCCPPHPSDPAAEAFYGNPLYASPLYASGVTGNPLYASPLYASAGGGGCCCCCGSSYGANPLYASPLYASADPNPAVTASQETGRRRSSAVPAPRPENLPGPAEREVRIAILDTGYAEDYVPAFPPQARFRLRGGDQPSEDNDAFLDPAAGHGTFIAGVIEQITPGCFLEVTEVLSTYGDGDEWFISRELQRLADMGNDTRPHLVNLSFGGYSTFGMGMLAHAIAVLHRKGSVVVASAGNDATCVPMFPAALPNVVGVGALDAEGNPAPFTNYGPWVRASTFGVDVVSSFFEGFDGPEPLDADKFDGWARWSGTSFAAPRVVAALAHEIIIQGVSAHDAMQNLVDDEQLDRKPMLGTVVVPA